MKKIYLFTIILSLIVLSSIAIAAPASEQLYYTKTTNLSAGPHILRFSLWTVSSGGTEVSNMPWWEIKTMNLASGDITTYLGNVADAAKRSGLLGDMDFSQQYWVQIDEVSGTAPNYIYTPVGTRTKLNMVPYAMHSITSENAATGGSVPSVTAGSGLTSTTSVDGDVTLNVGAGAGISVAADKVAIKAGGVTNTMLAAGAVTDTKITGPISIAKGGTGSITKNFVDLTTTQTIGGTKTFDGQIKSSVTTGTAPLQVASTTMVNNLNADLLDGKHSAEIIAAARDEVRSQISACGVTISTPGSYYITQNLYMTTGTCITVKSDDVTIDLMGLSLTGSGATDTYGIFLDNYSNVEIRNGTIRGFAWGIFSYAGGRSNRITGVRAMENGTGISLSSYSSVISGCTAANNSTGIGISAGTSSLVTGNTAYQNAYSGISAGPGSVVTGNTSYTNSFNGISATASTIIGNAVFNNGQNGIRSYGSSSIKDNTVYANNISNATAYAGIYAENQDMIKGNTVTSNYINNIYVTGSKNAIEENLVTTSTNGIFFNGSYNFYANNRARGNSTNYNLGTTTQTNGGGNYSF